MRQFRLATPTSSISNINFKSHSDTKKEKLSTCACSKEENIKRRNQVISANASPTIAKLMKMRSRTATNSVSPENAALVIKDYIMPLFKLERDSKHIKRRSELYNTPKNKQTGSKDSNMLSDFKLVNQLSAEINKLKENNYNINQQLKEADQYKETYESENKQIKHNLITAETNIMFLSYANTQNIKKTHQDIFGKLYVSEQYIKYKTLYEDEQRKCKNLSKMLDDEKENNDRLRVTAVQLEHVNTLLVMENDIIGEKLKGLYNSLTNIIGANSTYSKIKEEYKMITKSVYDLSNNISENNKIISQIYEEKKELEILAKELGDLTIGIEGRKDKYIKNLKERIYLTEGDLKTASFDREIQKSEIENLKKQYDDLKSEHLKLRARIKNFRISFSNDFILEKYCKNCQKPFIEATNYNWSCRRHSNQITDNIYWCCGQNGKEAPGCITSKHISIESSNEIEYENSDKHKQVIFCSVFLYLGL